MTGMWVKQLGRDHDCLSENRDVLSVAGAAEHGEGSMWLCDCGTMWIITDDSGVHKWRQRPFVRDASYSSSSAVDFNDDPEWRFR